MSLLDTTKLVLKSLVCSSPKPLTLEQLDHDFREQEGKRIPFSQLGSTSLKSFLLSMPDVLAYDSHKRVFTLAANDAGNSEPESLKRRPALKYCLINLIHFMKQRRYSRHQHQHFDDRMNERTDLLLQHIHKLVAGQKSNRRKTNNSKSFNQSNHSNNSNHYNNNRPNRELPTTPIWDIHPLNPNSNANFSQPSYNANYSQSNYIRPNYSQPTYNHPINNQPIRSYQNYSVNGYPTSHQARPFEPGNLLDPPNYVRTSLLGLPRTLPLMTINIPLSAATNQTPASRHDPNGRPNHFNKSKPDAFKKKSESNSSSSIDVAPKVDKKQNDDAVTLDEEADSNPEESGALPPMDDDDPINLIGSKMMSSKYGRNIPPAALPKTLESGHFQQVYVTEVTKFPYFYFQFAGTDDAMRGLQGQLDVTYGDNNSDVRSERILRSEIQIGNVCAAYYANKWSRAEILSHDNDRVKLLFVDYGTIDYVSVDETRYLHADICETPRLCHRGSLAFLEPLNNERLEKKIVKMICEMVADKSLIAVFSNVDEGDDIAMTLVDTSDKKVDLIVNKILMENLSGSEHKSN